MDGWISTSFLVFVMLAFQDVLHRFMMKEGFGAIELVLYGFVPTMVTIVAYIYFKRIKLIRPNTYQASLFILSGVLSFYGFLLLRQAQIDSPNIGYVNAIVYSSVLLTILLTALFFRDHLHWRGLLGAVLVILGIGLITSINGHGKK